MPQPKINKKEIADNLINSNAIGYTLLRSIASSQASSWVDMFIGFACFAWLGLTPFLSTGIGAFIGGVLNCYINYTFTFHASDTSWRAVIVKFGLVWAGSWLLNSFGTQIAYYAIDGWEWLRSLGFNNDGCYAAARLAVAFLVSAFWNFLLQRYFVFRPTRFDRYAIAFVNLLRPRIKLHKSTTTPEK